MAALKPTTPLRAPEQQPLKPPSPLQPKNAPKTPISHPQRRWRFQFDASRHEQRRWRFQSRLGRRPHRRRRFQTGPPGRRGPAAVPVGGGRARAGLKIDHSERSSRVAISRAGRRPPAHTAAGPHKASQEPLHGIAKGAGISRPLARVPSLIHEGHLDATHQRGDDVVEHGSQR